MAATVRQPRSEGNALVVERSSPPMFKEQEETRSGGAWKNAEDARRKDWESRSVEERKRQEPCDVGENKDSITDVGHCEELGNAAAGQGGRTREAKDTAGQSGEYKTSGASDWWSVRLASASSPGEPEIKGEEGQKAGEPRPRRVVGQASVFPFYGQPA